jgi:hypothetical protein
MLRMTRRCETDRCPRRATRFRVVPGIGSETRCDEHSDAIRWSNVEEATLIRESERLIAEANDRPSVRALPTGERS